MAQPDPRKNSVIVAMVRGERGEAEANAHLISQAPNLYSRLARHVTNCPCRAVTGVLCYDCEGDRKVLARARGEGADDG